MATRKPPGILLFETESGDPVARLTHTNDLERLDWSPDGRWLATGSGDGMPRLWDLSSTHIPSSSLALQGNNSVVRAVDFSSDNRWVAVGGDDRIVRVWDLRATDLTTPAISLRAHTGVIRALQFTSDGQWLASAGDEGAVLLWDVATITGTNPTPAFWLYDHEGSVRDIDIDAFLGQVKLTLRTSTSIVLAIAGNAAKAFPGLGTLGGGVVHAIAYGLIFDSLGTAVATTMREHHRLDSRQASAALASLLADGSAERLRRIAGYALQGQERET